MGPVTQLPVTGGYRRLPAVTNAYRRLPTFTGAYRRVWPPPKKDFKQNGRSQQQIKYLKRMQPSAV
eukprot:6612531-Heterocapsa_arctica.AAC.1